MASSGMTGALSLSPAIKIVARFVEVSILGLRKTPYLLRFEMPIRLGRSRMNPVPPANSAAQE
jgi:hypothetical protein